MSFLGGGAANQPPHPHPNALFGNPFLGQPPAPRLSPPAPAAFGQLSAPPQPQQSIITAQGSSYFLSNPVMSAAAQHQPQQLHSEGGDVAVHASSIPSYGRSPSPLRPGSMPLMGHPAAAPATDGSESVIAVAVDASSCDDCCLIWPAGVRSSNTASNCHCPRWPSNNISIRSSNSSTSSSNSNSNSRRPLQATSLPTLPPYPRPIRRSLPSLPVTCRPRAGTVLVAVVRFSTSARSVV